ncbi:MAG: hypothetical protein Tp1125DCM00d2C21254131_60 [Prokaryotic dsDNA virus sp.]|nr:MAG: hypothetical protein Tp1125DCM00d2C21254131_60 [Prokaryotic dsDNA virus sp.]
MKISKRKTQKKDKTQWNDWFAWYPVRIGEDLVWLETVQRRGVETIVATYDHNMVLAEEVIEYEYRSKTD